MQIQHKQREKRKRCFSFSKEKIEQLRLSVGNDVHGILSSSSSTWSEHVRSESDLIWLTCFQYFPYGHIYQCQDAHIFHFASVNRQSVLALLDLLRLLSKIHRFPREFPRDSWHLGFSARNEDRIEWWPRGTKVNRRDPKKERKLKGSLLVVLDRDSLDLSVYPARELGDPAKVQAVNCLSSTQ